jgi:hypothetical protein
MSLWPMLTGTNPNSEKEILITLVIFRMGVGRVRTFRSSSISRLTTLLPNQAITCVPAGELLVMERIERNLA